MDEKFVYSIAIHEAGHAVAALVFGLDIVESSIDIEADACFVEFKEFFPAIETDERNRAFAVMCLSGFAAQYFYDPRIDTSTQEHHIKDDIDSVLLCIQATTQDATEQAVLRREWSYSARDLVAQHWEPIKRVANALYARKSLSASEITLIAGIN